MGAQLTINDFHRQWWIHTYDVGEYAANNDMDGEMDGETTVEMDGETTDEMDIVIADGQQVDHAEIRPAVQRLMNQYQQWPLHQQIQVRQRIDELASGTLPPVNNPNITRQRGRPVGARNRQHNTSSTRRDPSGFELVERPARLCGRCRQPGHNIRSCPNPPPTHTHNR
jgi:hypothetical protein